MADALTAAFVVIGAAFALIAGLGLHRFDDVFARMHSATKPATLGLVLVVLGAAVQAGGADQVAKLALIVVLQFLTAPVAAHMVGRAAYRAGTELSPTTVLDEMADAPVPRPGRAPETKESHGESSDSG